MSNHRTIEGEISARGARFGIVRSRFNELITDRLFRGAMETLQDHDVDLSRIEVAIVPGAFEIPLTIKRMAQTGRFDALIALGCVIRGATPHFEYVAGECASGIAWVSLEHDIPIGFGVLTVDTIEQAIERAGNDAGNKGADAALAAIETLSVLQQIG